MIAMQLAEVPAHGTTAPTYSATAVWNGTTHTVTSRSEPSCKLARHLVELGAEDQPWTATQNGTPVWRGRSLHGWAKLTVIERDGHRACFERYTETPSSASGWPSRAAPASEPVHRTPGGAAPPYSTTTGAAS